MKNITSAQLKQMSKEQLLAVCEQLRQTIISTVMKNGGHLSSNLGMVELTVALHYVFDFPEDKVVFDVGHQCYTHKILSGRAECFDSLRKRGGISGFPKREESEFDCYDTGHAGTAISAALGLAKARDVQGQNHNIIAVIGDGSFNNGLIYEAFNSLRLLNTNVLVIINDNGMSIAPTVGSMHEYLELLTENAQHQEKRARRAVIFEKFGFAYDGVYNGNDLFVMIEKLQAIKQQLQRKSVILHVNTVKGKGYEFCEENPEQTHGISAGNTVCKEYASVLGETLCELAQNDEKIAVVTAAMTSALGLDEFFKKYPERSIDVGICEEHATILSASLAVGGLKPYFAVYSTFLQRCFDEIVIDICGQNLPVTMCVDRAGVSGADGQTHQGVFDLSFLSLIPNLTIAVPKDAYEFKIMLKESAHFNAPLVIRYPRECRTLFHNTEEFVFGRWETLERGSSDTVILACGERALTIAYAVLQCAKREDIKLINARFVKPLDEICLNQLTENKVITIEDNAFIGGFGSLISAFYAQSDKKVKSFALKDEFIPHGTVHELMSEFGLNVDEIVQYLYEDEN